MIFIDTGAFLGRFITEDQHHNAASEIWNKLSKLEERLFTSNFVLDEMITLLARRAGYAFAAQRARVIYSSNIISILRPTVEDEAAGIELFDKYSDQSVSFTDCISFVLMRTRKIKRVFSFDRHFEILGFDLLP